MDFISLLKLKEKKKGGGTGNVSPHPCDCHRQFSKTQDGWTDSPTVYVFTDSHVGF